MRTTPGTTTLTIDRQNAGTIACALASVAGFVAAHGWQQVMKRNESVRTRIAPRAWDAAIDDRIVAAADGTQERVAPWVHVWTSSGHVIQGWVKQYAVSAETDTVDLYLCEPSWIDGDNPPVPMTGVDGVYIPEASIELIQVMEPNTDVGR